MAENMSSTLPTPAGAQAAFDTREETFRVVYEHPWPVRFCHWANTISLFVLAGSGLQVFRAFPSFGAKIPQRNLWNVPSSLTIGGWLGGALQWHVTFAWIYLITGVFYLGYQIFSGNYRQVLFRLRDLGGVWPMTRFYFFFGRKPAQAEAYNPLQKLAYSLAVFLGVISVLTGMVLYNPVQFSFLGSLMGGFHWARLWHFGVLAALVLFVAGHIVMVVLHGWNNFMSMLTGWKRNPDYLE
jgi:Ni/Fe-hydrogenase b-type cytochrome subunit